MTRTRTTQATQGCPGTTCWGARETDVRARSGAHGVPVTQGVGQAARGTIGYPQPGEARPQFSQFRFPNSKAFLPLLLSVFLLLLLLSQQMDLQFASMAPRGAPPQKNGRPYPREFDPQFADKIPRGPSQKEITNHDGRLGVSDWQYPEMHEPNCQKRGCI